MILKIIDYQIILGFECFDKINSIELISINYINEQLQQLYILKIY